MFETLRAAIIRVVARRWLRTSAASWEKLGLPSDEPVVTSPGPDPDRILLFGAGISMGYGVDTHERALPGQLARQVAAITHRGVRVDVVAGENLTVETALEHLRVGRLRELDVVIATPGNLEKLLLLPASAWRARVEYLLDHFSTNAPASLRVLFVGMPELSRIVRMPLLLGRLADRSARHLNRALAESCSTRPYAQFVQFRPDEQTGRDGSGRPYELWASLIAPAVAAALDEHHEAGLRIPR